MAPNKVFSQAPAPALIRIVLLLLLTAIGVVSFGAPSHAALTSTTAKCPTLAVVGLRGSDQSMSSGSIPVFGPEVSGVARNMVSRIKRTGTYKYLGIPYDAKLKNSWGWIDSGVYAASVNDGIALTRSILNARATACPGTKYVLIGYSQGAEVIRKSMPGLSSGVRSRIVGVGLIADPTRRGFNLTEPEQALHQTFNTGVLYKSGFRGAGSPYRYYFSGPSSKVATFCQKADGVCNAEAGSVWSAATSTAHSTWYNNSTRISLMGSGLYSRVQANGFS